jgi:hypothetical protein
MWFGAMGLASLQGPMKLLLGGAAEGMGVMLATSLLWACAMGHLELDMQLVPKDDG